MGYTEIDYYRSILKKIESLELQVIAQDKIIVRLNSTIEGVLKAKEQSTSQEVVKEKVGKTATKKDS